MRAAELKDRAVAVGTVAFWTIVTLPFVAFIFIAAFNPEIVK